MRQDPGIDWTTLSEDGRELEQLARDLLNALGYRAAWSGEGPDGGRDATALEPGSADFGGYPRKWLVSCKHKAVSGRAVSYDDVGNIPGRLEQHGCQGFLLVTTTHPSAALLETFRGWETHTRYVFHYWDEPTLRLLLRRPEASHVLATYFPIGIEGGEDEEAEEWSALPEFTRLASTPVREGELSYLAAPGIAFYFQTRGREGPDDGAGHRHEAQLAWEHLMSELPGLRWAIRGVFYDDKNSTYTWRVDVAPAGTEGTIPDAGVLEERLSSVLVWPGDYGGQWHAFECRVLPVGPLPWVTPRDPNEQALNLFSDWPTGESNTDD